jgi:hypothetical protein
LVSGHRHVSHVRFDELGVILDTGERGPPELRWTYTLPSDTTLTGEPPWLIGGDKTLLVLTARNYGYTLQRLDPERGKPLWKEERLLSSQPLDPNCFALDSTAFYFVADNLLCAHALSDGKRLWERLLVGPAGRWQARRAGDFLITYPLDTPTERFQLRWLGASVEWQITRPFEEPARRGFPVVVSEAKTGQSVQRLNFAPAGAGLTARSGVGSPITLLPVIQHSRPPREAVAPVVLLTDQGMVVALEGRAWGLAGSKK